MAVKNITREDVVNVATSLNVVLSDTIIDNIVQKVNNMEFNILDPWYINIEDIIYEIKNSSEK